MKKIAEFFITNYKFTLVLSLGVVIFGAMGMLSIKSETYPSVNFSVATITTRYDGASAKDIELKITKPIEDEIRTITGIKDTRSVSQSGLSVITVRVDDEAYDLSIVMSDLERAIDRVRDLPPDLQDPPEFQEIKSEEMPVLELAITGDNTNRARDLVADYLKEDIEDLKDILNVRLTGFHPRIFTIEFDLKQLDRNHIGIDEIIAKLSARNINIPGGKVKKSMDQHLIRIDGKIEDTKDLEDIVIRANYSGKTIRLKDVAKVIDDGDEVPTVAMYQGEPATLVIATKKGGTDTIALVDEIMVKLEHFKKQYPEFKFHIYNNEQIKVKNKLEILSSNAVTGLILVLIFLLIFLPGRIGIMASLSLPLCVLFTFGFMPVFDVNLNAVTILALVIALGMLVDNSVVISENYTRLRDEGYNSHDAISKSIEHLWIPITATVFTTVAAFLPMLVTKGIMGKFIMYIPIIVSTALIISLFESFFLLPMRLHIVSRKGEGKKKEKPGIFDKISGTFERFIFFSVKFRYLTALAFTGLIAGSFVFMFVFNKVMLFPPEQVEVYVSTVELPVGATQEDTKKVVTEISQRIIQKKGQQIKHIVSRAGTNQTDVFDPKGQNSDNVGLIIIYVDEFTQNNIDDHVFLKELRSIEMPELVKVQFSAAANGPPVGTPVQATIRSNNKENLDLAIDKIMEELAANDGIIDITVDDVKENDEITVDIDHKKASMLGLDVSAIGNAIRTSISGRVISNVNIDGKQVDIKLQLDEKNRKNGSSLSQIHVLDHRGNLIPVSKVAKILEHEGTHQIKRYDYKRAKTITANITEGEITAIEANGKLKDIFAEVSKEIPNLSLIFGGEQESTNESMSSLADALVLSMIGIFALLVLLFNSFLRPMIIMSTIFLGLVGFSIAFFLHQKPISFLAMIGMIGLGGIIVNSGIILISFIDQLSKEEPELSRIEVLAKASKLRLRAVLVSSLTTISGLIPTAYGIGGLDAMLMPMTLAMAWGLTSGTILTLVWVPSAYAILEDITDFTAKIFGVKQP